MKDEEQLARWLCATKEFVDRDGPRLELDDEYDQWVLTDYYADYADYPENPDPKSPYLPGASPHDFAKAILQFLQS